MTTALKLFYAPRSRAFTALWILEELGIEYELESFDISSGRHKKEDYLALNPMGKIPVVTHGDVAIAETGAIAIYLSDLFTQNALAPALDDATRPDYLRWIFFSASVMEPAYCEKFFDWWQNPPASSVAWGSFDDMERALEEGLRGGPWLLGDTFSAADVVVGSTLRFGQLFGAMPRDGIFGEYTARLTAREAFKRAEAIEARESERFPR